MTDHCCEQWPRIRPHLGWFMLDNDDVMVAPVIGPAAAGAIRVNFCPSCGADRRDARWSFDESLGS